MGFFSAFTSPMPVHAINYGMKPNLKFTIREIYADGEDLFLHDPFLMVGKGHIRICSRNEDIPPFTLRIDSFKEFTIYGVKNYKWTIFNQTSGDSLTSKTFNVGELVLFFENNSVAIWNLNGHQENHFSMRIVTDKNSWL